MMTSINIKNPRDRYPFPLIFLILMGVTLLSSLYSLKVGATIITMDEVLRFLFSGMDSSQFILYELRFPRVLMAWFVGSLLAASGCLLQVLTRNPLGSPDILGINAGASLAAITYMVFFPAWPLEMLPLISIAGGFACASLIYFFARQNHLTSVGLTVTGVALHIFCSSLIQLLISLKSMEIHTALSWLAGSFWGKNWGHVAVIVLPAVLILGIIYVQSFRLNIFYLEDDLIQSLGENWNRSRFFFLILSVMAAGLSVALVGPISFMALLSPQMARFLCGPDLKKMLPLSALIATMILLLSDALGRGLLPPLEIPAGLFTPIIGVPYFLFLLKQNSSGGKWKKI